MTNVITIHNAVNERCWQEVMKWEQLHKVREGATFVFFYFEVCLHLNPKARDAR